MLEPVSIHESYFIQGDVVASVNCDSAYQVGQVSAFEDRPRIERGLNLIIAIETQLRQE